MILMNFLVYSLQQLECLHCTPMEEGFHHWLAIPNHLNEWGLHLWASFQCSPASFRKLTVVYGVHPPEFGEHLKENLLYLAMQSTLIVTTLARCITSQEHCVYTFKKEKK